MDWHGDLDRHMVCNLASSMMSMMSMKFPTSLLMDGVWTAPPWEPLP